MAELINVDLSGRSRRLRVDTLVTLRWLALLGQAIALVVTYFGLRFSLPLGHCLLVILNTQHMRSFQHQVSRFNIMPKRNMVKVVVFHYFAVRLIPERNRRPVWLKE